MIAGFVLVSAMVGMIAVGLTVALSLPLWITLAAYPAISSLTLLMAAALWNIRSTAPASREALSVNYSHG
jgi:hypothetical protein